MQNQFSRTQMLFGKPAINTLRGSRVAVFGIGGVGGYVVEVLARSGIGELDLIDNDIVCESNLNRQIIALQSTIGKYKVDVAAERIHDINPDCIVHRYQMFYLPANADVIDLQQFDYVVDCIDTIKAKLELIRRCNRLNVPIISCMGAANKLDQTAFRVGDLSKTQMDPLAKVLRKTLRKEGITHLKVVYSEEEPLYPIESSGNISADSNTNNTNSRRETPASNAFVPAAAGLAVGGEVVKDLISKAQTMRILPEEEDGNVLAEQAEAKARKKEERLMEIRRQRAEGKDPLEKIIIPMP
ncbi:MAG: tRNA threonylcarbamoyladenosine dehydratase [Prevotella sp.]|nr:tRNA threonylcarbamoyladenosine dehydratase [Prevotella sp.]